ncbi:AMP-binding domain-containing protein [Fusarium sp. LHS14.1]|nr:AMP-binding domain-containing protein [Fusarium sp. LHS14.1]
MMLGRSDGVLNPSGVRFGSSEIYAITETLPEISDSICVGQKRDIDEDERVLLFVKMSPGQTLTTELEIKIASAIREGCSPRHVPRAIFEVSDIPYTLNGKKCEMNVEHVINGRRVTVSGAVANPEALELFEKYRELPAETTRNSNRAKL